MLPSRKLEQEVPPATRCDDTYIPTSGRLRLGSDYVPVRVGGNGCCCRWGVARELRPRGVILTVVLGLFGPFSISKNGVKVCGIRPAFEDVCTG